jgi:muramoyltetrapeptide carboxypeptidase
VPHAGGDLVPRLIKPRALPPGGTIGIAAPGSPIDADKLEAGAALWREAGFRVVHRDDVVAREGYLAGDDDRRATELMELVEDRSVDAILCARGGYGCDRILERLDPVAFRRARKPLAGYSDITALLLWQQRRAGLAGFHGPMIEYGAETDRASLRGLAAQLTGEAAVPIALQGRGASGGRAQGRLVGGNLIIVAASLGTPWEIQTKGAILLLEEVGELPYRVDRLLQQLRGAGKLAPLAGVGVGDFSQCTDDRYPDHGITRVLDEVFGPLGVPVVYDLPFGHTQRNATWPFAGRATLDGDSGVLQILERGVVRAS